MTRQATTARCALIQAKQRFNVSRQSTGGFDRLLPHTERDLPLAQMPKTDDPCLATIENPGNVG
jgi:hypothetical protein